MNCSRFCCSCGCFILIIIITETMMRVLSRPNLVNYLQCGFFLLICDSYDQELETENAKLLSRLADCHCCEVSQ